MTLRERIALGAASVGFVLVVAGASHWGWWWACGVAGVLLVGASVALGTGDPDELEVDTEHLGEPDDEEWKVYEVRGEDDAGQGPGGGGR